MKYNVYETGTNRKRASRPKEYGTVRIPRRGFVRSYRANLSSLAVGVETLRFAGGACAQLYRDRLE